MKPILSRLGKLVLVGTLFMAYQPASCTLNLDEASIQSLLGLVDSNFDFGMRFGVGPDRPSHHGDDGDDDGHHDDVNDDVGGDSD